MVTDVHRPSARAARGRWSRGPQRQAAQRSGRPFVSEARATTVSPAEGRQPTDHRAKRLEPSDSLRELRVSAVMHSRVLSFSLSP